MSRFVNVAMSVAVGLVIASATPANAQSGSGTASAQLVMEVIGEAAVFSFEMGTDADGNPGRLVQLSGDIEGINFEPGTCNPGIDMSNPSFLTRCVNFGSGPGQFERARPGQTAFTTCQCTVAGIGGDDSSFILRISYPKGTPPQYPFGFTKFTFQDGTGALAGLRGQGTLDFAANPQVTFNYHFAGR